MEKSMQPKQFVAVVRNPKTDTLFMVFQSGDSRFYLFDPLDEHGCSRCMQFPVRKKDLKTDVRRALAHGYGNGSLPA